MARSLTHPGARSHPPRVTGWARIHRLVIVYITISKSIGLWEGKTPSDRIGDAARMLVCGRILPGGVYERAA